MTVTFQGAADLSCLDLLLRVYDAGWLTSLSTEELLLIQMKKLLHSMW